MYESVSTTLMSVYVNVVLCLSVWLFLKRRSFRPWLFFLSAAFIVQAGLLYYYVYLMHPYEPITLLEAGVLVGIFLPPVAMGIYVGVRRAEST